MKEGSIMKSTLFNKIYVSILFVCLLAAVVPLSATGALTSGETYTVTVFKVNNDGTTTEVTLATAVADDDGKISFALSDVPTYPDTKFLYLTLKDSNDTMIRQGFTPAPPANSENELGVNAVSTSQTKALLQVLSAIGTDDPIPVAFMLIFTRSPNISDDDIARLATLGQSCIIGENGFEDFLTNNGVTADQLATFKNKLIYNDTSGAKDLSNFTSLFKTAVDTGADSEMAKAAGLMAEIFVDAGAAAGIDPGLILAAHDAAGEVSMTAEMLAVMAAIDDTNLNSIIDQSMTAFFTRIAATKIEKEYTDALNTLNASGSQVTTYLAAVQTMVSAFETIDITFSEYFMDPDGFIAADNGYNSHDAVQSALDTMFTAGFTDFENAIQSSVDEINQMRQNVATALDCSVDDLGTDFGYMYNMSGQQVRWPVPQTVMVNWIASVISAGGSLSYTRDDIAIPDTMEWIGTCQGKDNSNDECYDKSCCESDNGTWVSQRHDFSGDDASFAALRGLEEDIRIIEFTRYATFDASQSLAPEEARAAEKAARLLFLQRLEATAGRLGGTTDGSTLISTDQKEAMVKLIQEPSLH